MWTIGFYPSLVISFTKLQTGRIQLRKEYFARETRNREQIAFQETIEDLNRDIHWLDKLSWWLDTGPAGRTCFLSR